MLALNPRLKGEAAGVFVVFFFSHKFFFVVFFFLINFLNPRLKGETAGVFVVFFLVPGVITTTIGQFAIRKK